MSWEIKNFKCAVKSDTIRFTCCYIANCIIKTECNLLYFYCLAILATIVEHADMGVSKAAQKCGHIYL